MQFKTYWPSRVVGGLSIILSKEVIKVSLVVSAVMLVRSWIHKQTSGFGEPGVGYLTDFDGGKDPFLTIPAGLELAPSWPIWFPNHGNSRDVTWITNYMMRDNLRTNRPSTLTTKVYTRVNYMYIYIYILTMQLTNN